MLSYFKKSPVPLFFICLFLYILTINFLYPMMVDDFYYTLHFNGFKDAISQIIYTTKNQYLTWSGRFFTNFIQFSLLPFIPLFNILNASMFCLFIYAIFLVTQLRIPNKYSDLFTLIFITTIVWFFIEGLAESSFWKIGAFNYLWPLTGTLYLIYPFLKFFNNNNPIFNSKLKTILFSCAAFVMGGTHEILSVTISILLIFINFHSWYRFKKIPNWIIASSISYFIGSLILIIGPGNYVRAAHMTVQHGGILSFYANKFGLLSKTIFLHITTLTNTLPLFLLFEAALFNLLLSGYLKNRTHRNILIFLIFCSVCIVFLFQNKGVLRLINLCFFLISSFFLIAILIKNKHQNNNSLALLFITLFFISAYVLLIGSVGMYAGRTAFISDIFLILAFIIILSQENFIFRRKKFFYGFSSLICIIFMMTNMVTNYHNMKLLHAQMEKRIQLLMLYKKNNQQTVILPAFYIPEIQDQMRYSDNKSLLIADAHVYISDLSSIHPSNWRNHYFAKYFGMPKAQITVSPFVERWSEIAPKQTLNNPKENSNLLIHDQKIFYISTNGPCDLLTNKNTLFVNIYPKQLTNLNKSLRKNGFESFSLSSTADHIVKIISEQGTVRNDLCVLAMHLPNYPINKIEIGQLDVISNKENTW